MIYVAIGVLLVCVILGSVIAIKHLIDAIFEKHFAAVKLIYMLNGTDIYLKLEDTAPKEQYVEEDGTIKEIVEGK